MENQRTRNIAWSLTSLKHLHRRKNDVLNFSQFFQLSPDGILIIKRDGTIHLANPALAAMVGASKPAELIGEEIRKLVVPEQLESCLSYLTIVFTSALQLSPMEMDFLHADGTRFTVEVAFGPFNLETETATQMVVRDISQRKEAEAELIRSNMELELAYRATLDGWSRALDLRDHETKGHTQRVTERTINLALGMGITVSDVFHIRHGALLHDIGKMAIPDNILLKPGPLNNDEWEIMRKHPDYAFELLRPIGYLQPALDIPYCHHEKWDGSGYPRGLKGLEIPLSARVFAPIDVLDALLSDRPYRPAWSADRVYEYIWVNKGTYFDPDVIDVLFKDLGVAI
jgi:PAS domain S-box-containing protein